MACIGFDLGTTYSCIAIWERNGVQVIPNKLGARTTPSWVRPSAAISSNARWWYRACRWLAHR